MNSKEYFHKRKRLVVNEESFIGAGSQWEVFRIKLKDCDLNDKSMIYKKSINMNSYSYQHNLQIYKHIKNAGLRTLEFYDSGKVDDLDAIFAQDLNTESRFYVSPNSARKKGNFQEKLINSLLQGKEYDEYEGVPEAEKLLLQNKLEEVNNLEETMLLIHDQMEIATANNICTCADAFFFGLDQSKKIITDIVIADFDNIHKSRIDKRKKSCNEIEMLNSLWEFIDNFVKDLSAKEYKSIIEEIIIKLQEDIA